MNKLLLLIPCFAAIYLFSCRKDSFITGKNAVIKFSSDTLFFDTVFTTTGSVTQSVKIFNDNDQKLRLSDLTLMGGDQSYFTLNIDGSPGPEQTNLELAAGDSLYIFVAVRINPNSANLPFIVKDSIRVSFNGNDQYIQLQAWGQNAIFLRNQKITGHVTWNNTLPYVILGGLQIDTNASLLIPQGCRVYFHADAPLLVDGSLQVTGDVYDSTRVIFQSDRLDAPYRNFPGSWPGIYFRETSINNSLHYAVIRNAYQGVVAEAPSSNGATKLLLTQCVIDNSFDAGILGAQSSIQASNCLVSNCGKNIVLGYGGNYAFTHCTAASFSNTFITHTQPVLSVSNYIVQGTTPVTADLYANFINCIFWGDFGNVDNEVSVSRQGNNPFVVNFSNCLWKVKTVPADIGSANMIVNSDPFFDSVNTFQRIYDFHLKAKSPAIDQGTGTGLLLDLDGHPRTVGLPDLGCYERQ
ncbi:choice-of-anchor Q domain-containing protein [Flavitalea flava]